MKILILTSWYPSDSNIISGVFVQEQAKALQHNGLEPIVFYPYDKKIKKNTLEYSYESGIKVYRANTEYLKNSKISMMNGIIKSTKFLHKIVKDESIELVHSHVCYPSGFVANLNKVLYGTPYIITEHMSTIGEYSKKFYNKVLLKHAYSNANLVICVSSFLENQLKDLGYKFKSEVLGNIVDVNNIKISKMKMNEDEIKILFIGGMDDSEVKGLNYFIPALAQFIKENEKYKIQLTLIGEGSKRIEYEKLAFELGIGDNCSFSGYIKKNEISEYFYSHDFLVLPSIKETFGCVLIENMAAGKPVLATKCGGPEEVVNSKVGILVDIKDIAALKNGLVDMVGNYSEFSNIEIREYAVKNYSSSEIGKRLMEIYKKNLEDKGEI